MIGADVLKRTEGRADWPSLFVFCAALLLLAAAILPGNAYRWAAIALLALVVFGAADRAPPANALVVALGLYCLWLFANAAFMTQAYSADDQYRPLVLLGGFAVGATVRHDALTRFFSAGVAIMALLVLIGLLQFFFGFWHLAHNPQRAAATFITPNTFATAINLFLLPLIALAVTRVGSWRSYVLALWLFAGLLATESRGGWLAALAGVGVMTAYVDLARRRHLWRPALRMLAGLLGVTLVFMAAVRIAPTPGLSEVFGETIVSRGASYRVDIAMVTLARIAEHPLAGSGAGMFWPLYEMTKPAELDIGVSFPFAHNDYLQIWLEFGLSGIGLLCAIIAAALAMVLKARRANLSDPLPLACAAAVAGFFTHAMVDFPLYIPFLLLVIGLWLGALAAHASASRPASGLSRAVEHAKRLRSPLIMGTLLAAALAWLAQPALADYAGRRALADLRAGRADTALYWQSVARRLERRHAAHYWAEAVIWRDQAIQTGNKSLAAKADALLAEGIRADPYQVGTYLERARLHRTYPKLLERHASAEEIVSWTGEALRLRPYSQPVLTEHARTLRYAGRLDEARRIARTMLERHPESPLARAIDGELGASR